MKKWLRGGAVAVLCASCGWTFDWKALKPQGCVSDFAGVVDAGTKSDLEGYCARVEQSGGVRIVLVTIASLEGEPVEDVGKTIFQAWGDASNLNSDRDHRVMLMLSVADRRDWLETGLALEPRLTNRLRGNVLGATRPALRQKDYGEALRAAAETIGDAVARTRGLTQSARLSRRIRWSVTDSIPWPVVAGGILMVVLLIFAGSPAGYGGLAGRGFLPGLFRRGNMSRSTWGGRGTGGFGGFDSGDASGGFGGGAGRDW